MITAIIYYLKVLLFLNIEVSLDMESASPPAPATPAAKVIDMPILMISDSHYSCEMKLSLDMESASHPVPATPATALIEISDPYDQQSSISL
jgi:hypothetical protein